MARYKHIDTSPRFLFTLRRQKKLNVKWKRYSLVHNIKKLAHHGYAQ